MDFETDKERTHLLIRLARERSIIRLESPIDAHKSIVIDKLLGMAKDRMRNRGEGGAVEHVVCGSRGYVVKGGFEAEVWSRWRKTCKKRYMGVRDGFQRKMACRERTDYNAVNDPLLGSAILMAFLVLFSEFVPILFVQDVQPYRVQDVIRQ